MTCDFGNPGPGTGTNMWGLNQLMESPPSPLDKWISNSNTLLGIYKQMTKNLHRSTFKVK